MRVISVLTLFILIELTAVQIFNIDKFPFTTYPMYSTKISSTVDMTFFCNPEVPGQILAGRTLSPLYPKTVFSRLAFLRAYGPPSELNALLNKIRENANLSSVQNPDLKTDTLHIDLEQYLDFVLGKTQDRLRRKSLCASQ